MNVNVRITYIFSFLMTLASGITGTVSSILLYDLVGKNFYVGLAGAAQGVMQMLIAFPAGWWADKHKHVRAKLLKRGIIISWLACLITIWVLLNPSWSGTPGGSGSSDDWSKYFGLLAAYILWGISDGFTDPIIEAIFSDSIANGDERTKIESWRSLLANLGSSSGPLTSLMLFAYLGDDWSRDHLVMVWLVGISVALAATLCMCCYSDALANTNTNVHGGDDINTGIGPLLVLATEDQQTSLLLGQANSNLEIGGGRQNILGMSDAMRKRIPYLCIVCDILCALGSGMTVQFWALFFENGVKSTPIALNLTLLGACLSITLGVYLARVAAQRFGRIVVTLCSMFLGVSVLFAIGILHGLDNAKDHEWFISLLYILRAAFMNAPTPLLRATLMDNITSENRAKWASVESITVVGWTGSALLGGWLCDTYGYGVTFFITAALQALSLLPLLPLIKL